MSTPGHACRTLGTIGLFLVVFGCSPSSPYLVPQTNQNASSGSDIEVFVTPVVTSGFGSEQRGRYGVDLSSYFTSFEVKMVNRSNSVLDLDPQVITLTNGSSVQEAMGEEESLNYYRHGAGGTEKPLVLIEKPFGTIKKEMDQISALRLKEQSVSPGQIVSGLVYFNKVSPDRCTTLRLDIDGVTVETTGEEKDFRFDFRCPAKE